MVAELREKIQRERERWGQFGFMIDFLMTVIGSVGGTHKVL